MASPWHTGCRQCDRTDTHTHGALDADGYELRYAVDDAGRVQLDEVVARDAAVQLEAMGDGEWLLIVTLPSGAEVRVGIAAHGRGAVSAVAEVCDG